jgi:hypothetical protein
VGGIDMIFAQIKNGIVVNTIVLEDPSLMSAFSEGFDSIIEIDQLPGSPSIGWTYDGTNFYPPSVD